MKISVYIIAYNEIDKISDCINSVLWADEIIVADSNSTDGTSELAKRLGAKVTLYGENLAHALKKADEISKKNKYTFLYRNNDLKIIIKLEETN